MTIVGRIRRRRVGADGRRVRTRAASPISPAWRRRFSTRRAAASPTSEIARRLADDADRAEAAELTSAHPSMTLREGLARGGAATFVVLALLNSFDELEGAALAVLAPDIARRSTSATG